MDNILISICIPSYNRPKEILRLLNSIDCSFLDRIEIVIRENSSPRRSEIRKEVSLYKQTSKYAVLYIENESNLGFDGNLRALINVAKGDFIVFMGDDDTFISGALDSLFNFVEQHQDCGYILRSYRTITKTGNVEYFRYFSTDRKFQASDDTYVLLFDKSVFISGFTIRRKYAIEFETDKFDGSLLYQLYLLAEVCRKYPSAYFNTTITQSIEEEEGVIPYFGSSDVEKKIYSPGKATTSNNINFMQWYMTIIDHIAKKYQNHTNDTIRLNMSKYSYPILAQESDKKFKTYFHFFLELKRMGLGKSIYFYIFFTALSIFGRENCNKVIRFIKKKMGRRPEL